MALFRSLTALVVIGLLAACAATGTPGGPSSARGPNGVCQADGLQSFTGQSHDARLEDRARQRAGAATVRVLRPRSVMTLEYDPQRLNLRLNDNGVVESAYCG